MKTSNYSNINAPLVTEVFITPLIASMQCRLASRTSNAKENLYSKVVLTEAPEVKGSSSLKAPQLDEILEGVSYEKQVPAPYPSTSDLTTTLSCQSADSKALHLRQASRLLSQQRGTPSLKRETSTSGASKSCSRSATRKEAWIAIPKSRKSSSLY